MKERYNIFCPACDRITQHKKGHKRPGSHAFMEDELGRHYCCTCCLRTRLISDEALSDLLYEAIRHPYPFLKEAM